MKKAGVISILLFALLQSSAVSFASCDSTLKYMLSVAFPITKTNKNDTAFCSKALDSIKVTFPFIKQIDIGFVLETDSSDWKAVLDVVNYKGFKCMVIFFDTATGLQYRPIPIPNNINPTSFDYGKLGIFISTTSCINHPALYAVSTIDEPWNYGKGRYKTAWLQQIYTELHNLSTTSFKIYMNFSRGVWNKHYQFYDGYGGQGTESSVYYSPGICDIIQISTLEFQDGIYDINKLDSNHTFSRKIIQAYTPSIELWTSVQVFGANYGPSSGYWFPAAADLTTMLNDLTNTTYQNIKKINGMTFQQWDSPDLSIRPSQFTLGDITFIGSSPLEQTASANTISAINSWSGPCVTTGIAEMQFSKSEDECLKIFPNPSSNMKLNFSSCETIIEIGIADLNGKALIRKNIFSAQTELDVSQLPTGTYLVKARTANKFTVTKKIIIN